MPVDLFAASRDRHLALYDPAAIPPELELDPDLEAPEPEPPDETQIESLAAAGRALIVRIEEDCEAALRVFVDEPIPETLASIRDLPTLEGAVLEVPSGVLRADGIEFVVRPGEARTHGEGGSIEITPGRYRVRCRSLLAWKAHRRSPYVAEHTRPLERFAHRVYNVLGCLALVAVVITLLALPGMGVFFERLGWRTVLVMGAALATFDLLVFGLFWLVDHARSRHPELARAGEVSATFDREHPDLVVELESIEEEDATPARTAWLTVP